MSIENIRTNLEFCEKQRDKYPVGHPDNTYWNSWVYRLLVELDLLNHNQPRPTLGANERNIT